MKKTDKSKSILFPGDINYYKQWGDVVKVKSRDWAYRFLLIDKVKQDVCDVRKKSNESS